MPCEIFRKPIFFTHAGLSFGGERLFWEWSSLADLPAAVHPAHRLVIPTETAGSKPRTRKG
jgi:hypothetical protein